MLQKIKMKLYFYYCCAISRPTSTYSSLSYKCIAATSYSIMNAEQCLLNHRTSVQDSAFVFFPRLFRNCHFLCFCFVESLYCFMYSRIVLIIWFKFQDSSLQSKYRKKENTKSRERLKTTFLSVHHFKIYYRSILL